MKVRDILEQKGGEVISLLPETVIPGAALLLSQDDIGAAVVADPEAGIVGMISERDISRGLAEHGGGIVDMRVDELMTRDIITCDCEQSLADARALMRQNRIRHLPVTENGDKLVGLISMRDIVEFSVGASDC